MPTVLPYFAYGSNLDRAGMARRCPGARPLGFAQLRDHRFFIMANGYASVRHEPGAVVHGLLWAVTEPHLAALDAYEEIDSGLYRRTTVRVTVEADHVHALLYEGCDGRLGVPRADYMRVVLSAAEACGLPLPYQHELRAWLFPNAGGR